VWTNNKQSESNFKFHRRLHLHIVDCIFAELSAIPLYQPPNACIPAHIHDDNTGRCKQPDTNCDTHTHIHSLSLSLTPTHTHNHTPTPPTHLNSGQSTHLDMLATHKDENGRPVQTTPRRPSHTLALPPNHQTAPPVSSNFPTHPPTVSEGLVITLVFA